MGGLIIDDQLTQKSDAIIKKKILGPPVEQIRDLRILSEF